MLFASLWTGKRASVHFMKVELGSSGILSVDRELSRGRTCRGQEFVICHRFRKSLRCREFRVHCECRVLFILFSWMLCVLREVSNSSKLFYFNICFYKFVILWFCSLFAKIPNISKWKIDTPVLVCESLFCSYRIHTHNKCCWIKC